MPYNSIRLFKQVLFKIFLEENEEYSHEYVSLKRFYAENDDQVFYSMNKEPFVEKINSIAIKAYLDNVPIWEKRILEIMGYIPYCQVTGNIER